MAQNDFGYRTLLYSYEPTFCSAKAARAPPLFLVVPGLRFVKARALLTCGVKERRVALINHFAQGPAVGLEERNIRSKSEDKSGVASGVVYPHQLIVRPCGQTEDTQFISEPVLGDPRSGFRDYGLLWCRLRFKVC